MAASHSSSSAERPGGAVTDTGGTGSEAAMGAAGPAAGDEDGSLSSPVFVLGAAGTSGSAAGAPMLAVAGAAGAAGTAGVAGAAGADRTEPATVSLATPGAFIQRYPATPAPITTASPATAMTAGILLRFFSGGGGRRSGNMTGPQSTPSAIRCCMSDPMPGSVRRGG